MSEDKEEGGGSLNRNPDVLSCLANLSNDEVFTPPEVANAMLDLLPKELFENPETTFLDPASKSGVFLREIAKRLIEGLKGVIPDLEARVDHICKKQIFALSPTMLTALASRRTLYCSVHPAGKYSVAHFDNDEGNIRYFDGGHTFQNGRCSYCGASEAAWGEEARKGKESHAYEFIHGWQAQTLGQGGKMHFDVIVGNPPYQMGDGGAFASASPIYHKFVEVAKALDPHYISMIMPARWYAGGKGLDTFRATMLHDKRIKELHDYPIAGDCFPGIRVSGGLCYFLWDKNYNGDCTVHSHHINGKQEDTVMSRPLLEGNADTFVRINEAITILRKVQKLKEKSFSELISGLKPFGIRTDIFADPSKYGLPSIYKEKQNDSDITIIGLEKYKTVKRYVPSDYPFPNGKEYIGKWKVFVSQVLDNGFDWTKERLQPFLGCPFEVCTETFLRVGSFDTETEAKNVVSYMNTKFLNLMMQLRKVSHHVTQDVYQFVPLQNFSDNRDIDWTTSIAELDEQLYKKYSLTSEEVAFIEKMVRPMD